MTKAECKSLLFTHDKSRIKTQWNLCKANEVLNALEALGVDFECAGD